MNGFLIHVKIILLIRNKGEKHEKMVDTSTFCDTYVVCLR